MNGRLNYQRKWYYLKDIKRSKDMDENPHKYLWSDSNEIMIGVKADKIIHELFRSRRTNYQQALKSNMKGRDFVLNNVDGLSYLCHKISLNCGGSCIDSHDWRDN